MLCRQKTNPTYQLNTKKHTLNLSRKIEGNSARRVDAVLIRKVSGGRNRTRVLFLDQHEIKDIPFSHSCKTNISAGTKEEKKHTKIPIILRELLSVYVFVQHVFHGSITNALVTDHLRRQ